MLSRRGAALAAAKRLTPRGALGLGIASAAAAAWAQGGAAAVAACCPEGPGGPAAGAGGVSARKRVAILGGSFDPITDAHLKCAAEIIHCGVADEVWLVPCGARPDKPSLKRSVIDRLVMCHLAVNTTFGSRFPVRVSDIELHEPKALPTWDLLQRLKQTRQDIEPFFVIGSDLVPDLRKWDEGERLWNEEQFIVISRPGYELGDQSLPPHSVKLEPPAGAFTLASQELSSSEIRRRLHYVPHSVQFGERELQMLKGRNYPMVEGLVPPAVLAHIGRYNLYVDG